MTVYVFKYDVGGHFGPLFGTAILNLKIKTNPQYNEYHSVRSAKPELVENDTL